jgi:predicted patatin/cPLA2 family phospholipase
VAVLASDPVFERRRERCRYLYAVSDGESDSLMPHISDVALVFEGGGMRASYSAGAAVTLLEQEYSFDFVCGLSAGASHTVDFVSRDIGRTRDAFTEFVTDEHFGDFGTFLRGKGMFSAHWIYQEACLPDGAFPFDMEAFLANPTRVAIQAFDRDSGETTVWTNDDMRTLDDLMVRVRASSTLPIVMPPVEIDGHTYYDGGLGQGAGIPIHLAEDAGYTRFFCVLTRPRGYRKEPTGKAGRMTADLYRRYPHMREALLTRPERYNAELDRLERIAAEGRAYIVYADNMAVTNSTKDHEQLVKSYQDGYAQAQRELPRWREWLGA